MPKVGDKGTVRSLLLGSAVKYRASLLGLVVVILGGLTGCSQGPSHAEQESALGGQALVISPGVTVTSATYTITGPNGFTSAGTVPVGSSPDLSIVVNNLPLASGYEMDVLATGSDGVSTCEATTPFNATGPSTTLLVHLVCGVPTGDVQLTGSLNVCPALDGLDATPTEVVLGGHVLLTATAHDADNGPSPLTYKWTTNGAVLGNHPAPTLTFTCTSAGNVAIRVSVSDGDPDPTCGDSLAANVTCTGP